MSIYTQVYLVPGFSSKIFNVFSFTSDATHTDICLFHRKCPSRAQITDEVIESGK